MSTFVSVVIPCHNEAENIPLLTARIDSVFAEMAAYDYECLLVNDGSTDASRAVLEAQAAKNPAIRPLHLKKNCGQSAALVAGMRRAQGAYILTLDGDLQNDPVDFPKILALLQDYDCVCGYRAKRNDHWWRVFVSKSANKVLRVLVGNTVRDAGCGAKGFRRCCIEHFVSFNGMHRFFPVLVHAAGFTITELEVTHHPRVHGRSKYGINNRLWRTLYDAVGVSWLRRRYVRAEVEE